MLNPGQRASCLASLTHQTEPVIRFQKLSTFHAGFEVDAYLAPEEPEDEDWDEDD
jgi:hypothetical protein